MKKQISKCVKMLFLGIIMCLGMALSVHAEGSGQFFQFDAGDRCAGTGGTAGYYGNPVGLRLSVILTDKPVYAALLT